MLDTIRTAWNWTGLNPVEIVDSNCFGNLIVKDADDAFWRICPEELKCEKVAANAKQFAELARHPDFQSDWKMERLMKIAEKKLGRLKSGRCYCLKLSPIIGGAYDVSNIGEISIKELIAFSGDFAKQIKNVPDGGQIEIKLAP
jgi:hypothetical protein